jgi:Heterokaryon incompatibility protein (HET)
MRANSQQARICSSVPSSFLLCRDPSDCRIIILTRFPFKTFRSTHEALKRFRDPEQAIIKWIDQICINQTDIKERDSRVLLMGDIYTYAANTQIWLGEESLEPPSSGAFDLLEAFHKDNGKDLVEHIYKIAQKDPTPAARIERFGHPPQDFLHAQYDWIRYYRPDKSHGQDARYEEWCQEPALQQIRDWFLAAATVGEKFGAWSALFGLFEWSWWSRCWVAQEAAVSGKLTIKCSPLFISSDLVSIFSSLGKLRCSS